MLLHWTSRHLTSQLLDFTLVPAFELTVLQHELELDRPTQRTMLPALQACLVHFSNFAVGRSENVHAISH